MSQAAPAPSKHTKLPQRYECREDSDSEESEVRPSMADTLSKSRSPEPTCTASDFLVLRSMMAANDENTFFWGLLFAVSTMIDHETKDAARK